MRLNELPDDQDVVGLVAESIHLVNRLAHAFSRDSTIKNRLFSAKHDLLSLVLELPIPGIRAAWERQPQGHFLLVISIANHRALHCPFSSLSWSARCRIVQEIGPVPKA